MYEKNLDECEELDTRWVVVFVQNDATRPEAAAAIHFLYFHSFGVEKRDIQIIRYINIPKEI